MSGPENATPDPGPKPRPTSASMAPEPAPASEPAATPAAQPATAQATAAVSSAMTAVRERLQVGEQILLVGAALIIAVYLIFEVILGHRIFADGRIPVVIAVLTVLSIWVHRWGHYDFGNGYRILLGAFGVTLLLFAFTNFLTMVRFGLPGDGLFLLGLLLYWAGGAAALYGGWMVFRSRA